MIKEEHYLRKFGCIDSVDEIHCTPDELYPAMREFSEQESILFAEWVAKGKYEFKKYPDGMEGWTNSDNFCTTNQLFQLFKTQQTK